MAGVQGARGTVIKQGSVSLKQRPLTLDTLDSPQLIPRHCHRSLVGSVEVYYRSSDSVASDCDSNCDATGGGVGGGTITITQYQKIKLNDIIDSVIR